MREIITAQQARNETSPNWERNYKIALQEDRDKIQKAIATAIEQGKYETEFFRISTRAVEDELSKLGYDVITNDSTFAGDKIIAVSWDPRDLKP